MEGKDLTKQQEKKENFVKNEPVTSLLSKGEISKIGLPYEVRTEKKLNEECAERKELIKSLDYIYSKIPTLTNVEEALDKKLITVEDIEVFYNSIIDLIKKDKDSERLLLYFPFELLPNQKYEKLNFFKDFYKSNWKNLLGEIGLREDFNEGDILEKELRNSPLGKVSKAAHLIPYLVERNILSVDEILTILENEKNDVVIDSILNTLRILSEKKYLSDEDLSKLESSKNINIKNSVKMIRYDQKEKNQEVKVSKSENPRELFNSMNSELSSIEDSMSNKEKLTPERITWLKKVEKERIINRYTEIIYSNFSDLDQIENILKDKNLNEENTISIIKALEKIILNSNKNELGFNILKKIKTNENKNIQNQILNTLSRLKSVNINNSVNDLEIIKMEKKKEKDLEEKIKNVLLNLKTNPLLLKSVYPVTMLYGSQEKGYGKENSDLDIGFFIKENVDFNNRNEIKKSFKELLDKLNINGSVMEFWLKKENDSLWIQDFENPDNNLGDSLITSPIIGSWYGDKKTISDLQKELIPKYLYSENKHILGFEARKIWLKDMEHSLIQYRLMHKGYKEKNLEQGGIDSVYKDEIDGNSMFYDSGFRRMATKIYLEKVFLPQLKK